MRTRLRVHRQQDEDALRVTPGRAAPGQAPPAIAPLVSLQRTLGNAAFQRYLQRETGSPGRSDAVQREPDQPGKQADAAPGSRSITLLKIKTADGKEVRGPGKRKGHEGAFELLGFSNDTVRSPANMVGRRPPGDTDTNTEHFEGGSRTTSKELAEFTFIKALDASSPLLLQYSVNGKPLVMELEVFKVDPNGLESLVMKLELPDVLITSARPGGNANDNANTPLESISVQSLGISTTILDPLVRR